MLCNVYLTVQVLFIMSLFQPHTKIILSFTVFYSILFNYKPAGVAALLSVMTVGLDIESNTVLPMSEMIWAH